MKLIPSKHEKRYIEPEHPVTTPEEFIQELVNHFSKEGKFVTVQQEGMEPVIEVDGETFVCRLGEPYAGTNHFLHTPLRSGSLAWLGYQWIYLYHP